MTAQVRKFHRVSSRKKLRFNKKSKGKKRISFAFLKRGLLLILALSALILVSSHTKYWDSKTKLSIVSENGQDIDVITFDPASNEINEVIIPGDTLVTVARNLGSWRLKSVWKLGENEGLGGKLMVETVSRYFKIPVYVWADEPVIMFAEKNLYKIVKAVVTPYKTNLGIGDRIKIALFSLGVKNTKRNKVNLKDVGYLKLVDLPDGEKGWIVAGRLPKDLLGVFSIEEISNKSLKVEIENESGSIITADSVGGLVEVLGAKVVAVNVKDTTEADCEVWGKDRLLLEKVRLLFYCTDVSKSKDSTFDLTIRFGSRFVKRF